MDLDDARKILNIETMASVSEIETAFRKLAMSQHPDRGGSAESMDDLLRARDILLANISKSTDMVSADTVTKIVKLVTYESRAADLVDSSVNASKTILHNKCVNRLNQYRSTATIFTAILALSAFMSKDLPLEIIFHNDSENIERIALIDKQALAQLESNKKSILETPAIAAKEAKRIIAEMNAQETRLRLRIMQSDSNIADIKLQQKADLEWFKKFALLLALMGGVGTFLIKQLISNIELRLSELEQHTASKDLIHKLFRQIFSSKTEIPSSWTLVTLMEEVEHWSKLRTDDYRFKSLVQHVGTLYFSQYLIGRAKQLSIIESFDEYVNGEYAEKFSIKTTSDR